MFGLQVEAPFHRILEALAGGFEGVYGLGVGHTLKVGGDDALQGGDEFLVVEAVEEGHIVGAGLQGEGKDVAEKILGQVCQAV